MVKAPLGTGVHTAPDPSVGEDSKETSADVVGHLMTVLAPETVADSDTFRLVPTN